MDEHYPRTARLCRTAYAVPHDASLMPDVDEQEGMTPPTRADWVDFVLLIGVFGAGVAVGFLSRLIV